MDAGEKVLVGGLAVVAIGGIAWFWMRSREPVTVPIPVADQGAAVDQGSTERTAWVNLFSGLTNTVGGIVQNAQQQAMLDQLRRSGSSVPSTAVSASGKPTPTTFKPPTMVSK
jgi:hypothetical protein